MRVEQHFSAGGIVVRRVNDHDELALCGRDQPLLWALPKGTPDPGETVEQTALREVREETGLEVVIDRHAGDVEYWFNTASARVHKRVSFFLMHPTGGSLDAHDPEFDRVAWFPIDKALELVTYSNERQLLDKAVAMLGLHPPGASHAAAGHQDRPA